MNIGLISSRYARALLLLTQKNGSGEQVFSQARALLKDPSTAPSPLAEDLARLTLLLHRNGRGECMRFILNDFIQLTALLSAQNGASHHCYPCSGLAG